jgi:TRAP-type C4-dicarboxylate transport system permease small subunit
MTPARARIGSKFSGAYRGAIHLGLSDVLIILAVLAILLWASWKQFPTYNRSEAPAETLQPLPASTGGQPTPASAARAS